jgi:glutamate-ammonia-ligase adenylyltransferase
MALNHLQSFASFLSTRESYLEIFSNNKELIKMLTYVFSQSEYLSKMLMVRPQYLEMIGLQELVKKSLTAITEEIKIDISEGLSVNDAVRLIKQMEEMRLGLLFLEKRIEVIEVLKGLSKTAEAILSVCMEHISEENEDMAVIGFGKLGGREIAFNADLDVIFVCPEDVKQTNTKVAERLLRMLISYTKEGIAYRVDTRLRPEGSKGPLVSSIESFKKYYSKAAAFWEFQALLKARPVAGDRKTGLLFINMARNILVSRGNEISASDIRQMRERIIKELSKESEGFDIKLGPGGVEEIEFTVQYLQLTHCYRDERLLVQGTTDAIGRLMDSGILSESDATLLLESYIFYRALECFLRLRGENILKKEEDILKNTSEFMGFKDKVTFVEVLVQKRDAIKEITERYLVDS